MSFQVQGWCYVVVAALHPRGALYVSKHLTPKSVIRLSTGRNQLNSLRSFPLVSDWYKTRGETLQRGGTLQGNELIYSFWRFQK